MKKLTFIAAILSLCAMIGCNDSKTEEDTFKVGTGTGTYISSFVENSDFEIMYSHSLLVYDDYMFDFMIGYDIDSDHAINPPRDGMFSLLLTGDGNVSESDNTAEYKRLITELKDTTCPFDRENPDSSFADRDQPGVVSILNTIKGLTITAEPQYISSIPAGEPINECFDILYNDIVGTIWNGYERPADTYLSYFTWNPMDVHIDVPAYYRMVSAADTDKYCDRDYIGQDMFLILNVPPDKDGDYTFTFTITFADGTVKSHAYGPDSVKRQQ
jgi:hypothetical protein